MLFTRAQGLDVPDSVIAQGVKALKESRFVYTPPKPGFERWLARVWVKRATIGKWLGVSLAILALAAGTYHFSVVRPQRPKAGSGTNRTHADPAPGVGRRASSDPREFSGSGNQPKSGCSSCRGTCRTGSPNADGARAALASLDELSNTLRQEYTLRIAGRPEDQTGFFRENPRYQGRAYFVVVSAIDAKGNPVKIPVRNDETNQTETVSRFAVRVPLETFEAIRNDKSKNGIVQNVRLAEKRRGFVEAEYLMPVLEGRITRW